MGAYIHAIGVGENRIKEFSLHDCDRTKFIEMSTGKIFMWSNQAGLESKASLDLINWPPIVYWGRHLVSKRTYRTLDSVSLALNQRFRKYWKRLFFVTYFSHFHDKSSIWTTFCVPHGLVKNIFGMQFCFAIFNLCLIHRVSMVFTTRLRSWTWGLWHIFNQFG